MNEETSCGINCTECEGESHHYLPDCDEDSGDAIVTCKHCDWQTELTEEYDFIFD